MSLTEVLINILDLPKLTAIEQRAAFKKAAGASDFRSAVKSLPYNLKSALADLNSTEVNRRKIPNYEGFKIGDRVQIRLTTRTTRQVNRGRLRQYRSKRRILERRIGQTKQPIGWATSRGSRRLFYIRSRNLDRVLDVSPICPYPSLLGVELTIVEFVPPWVHCLRSSGSYAPGLLAEDLEIIYHLTL